VTDEAEVNAAFKAATQDGKLDVLILNAGIAVDTEGLAATPSQVMRDIMETNVMGVYFGLKLAPTYMNDGGSIITTGSAAGSGITTFGSGEYAASKAAAAYLTRTAAIEFADRAIRANVVCPAAIAGTGMMVADDGNPMAQFYATLTALGRMGNDTEAVALYRFLASEESSFITGQEIRIDGGATAGISGPITGMIAEKVGLG
jgi:NAD(P)-dependent dehydrogenase (short-subunit alcohol dehydrogenase family)